MQREIKFRAWDGETMYPPCNLWDREGSPIEWLNSLPYPDSILMQYTGLKDKQGKEIYEGDLVHYRLNEEYPAEVYFDERLAGYRLRVNGEMQFDKTYPVAFAQEVIGNIYENKERLNG